MKRGKKRVIWKFRLEPKQGIVQEIAMHGQFEFRSFGFQGWALTVWVEQPVDDQESSCIARFRLSFTGRPFEKEAGEIYRGTATCPNGLVWHLHELVRA